MKLAPIACTAGLGLLLAGCTLGPDFATPSLFTPSSWVASRPPPPPVASLPAPTPIDPAWWTLFNDPILTELEAQVAASNLDVRLATIRLAESRQQRGIAAADQFPTLNGNATYTREQISNKGVASLLGGGSGGAATQSNGTAGTSGGIPTSSLGASSGIGCGVASSRPMHRCSPRRNRGGM